MEKPRELHVRTIDGQSVKVAVKAEDTVHHLKACLRQLKWPPDSVSSPQFHLFLRGTKLDVSTSLGSLSPLDDADFLVLIPYSSKNKSKRRKMEIASRDKSSEQNPPSNSRMEDENNCSAVCTEFVDSGANTPLNEILQPTEAMWHTIFADLAAANSVSKNSEVANDLSEETSPRHRGEGNSGKQAFEEWGQLSNSEDVNLERGKSRDSGKSRRPVGNNSGRSEPVDKELDKQSQEVHLDTTKSQAHEKLLTVLPRSLTSALPPLLEKLKWVFTSLNTIFGFLQKQHMRATWQNVKQALQELCFSKGVEVTIQDIRHLALLCPRLVVLTNITGEGENSSFYIDLFDLSTLKKQEQLVNTNGGVAANTEQFCSSDLMLSSVGKRVCDKVIGNAMKRRHTAFQNTLTNLVEYLQKSGKSCNGVNDITIEDCIPAVKAIMKEDADHTLNPVLSKPPPRNKRMPRCANVANLGACEMMEHLKKGLGSLGQFVHCEHIKHRNAAYGKLQGTLTSYTNNALKQIGVTRLYTHQVEAIDAAMSGRNVIVATSTASGKSLCYNIPVLDEMYQNQESCALYLFPTKALAQDQLRALKEMSKNTSIEMRMGVYDGDTPQDQRLVLRDTARLLITNPDMLHVSIMPSHRQFARILSNLRYVVVDEGHAYRGVFGCHTSLILRRLCHYLYGTEPTFIVCSATVAYPSGHAQELLGLRKIQVVQNDGSPCGEKLFVLWNPLVIPASQNKKGRWYDKEDPEQDPKVFMKHASPIVEIAALLAEMVQHNLRCIAFCKTRKLCELVYTYTRDILKETAPDLVSTIRSYRGGYNPRERRSIESDLFSGKVRGVAATNALELGVDVGNLDATLHLGFPGTVASLWQQSGRAGRREKPSLSVYVAFASPLDQHFMKTPSRLFSLPIESAQVDAHNPQVMEQHLACAAVEYPLHVTRDEEFFGSGLQTAITELVNQGHLGRHPSNGPQDMSWHYIGEEKFPSQAVSIRAINPEKYNVIDVSTNDIIEEVEENKAFFQIYEGAVYMNQGKKYLVKTLDLAAKVAICQEADLKYYTKTRDFTDVHVTGAELAYSRNICENKYRSTTAQASICNVTTQWIGYHRIWQGNNEVFDTVDLFLPQMSYTSQAAWIRVPPQIRADLAAQELPFKAGIHAANHALLNVMPLYIMCNPSDLGTECVHPKHTRYYPDRLLVFDRCPGGIGIATQARPMFAELLQAALELLASCDCTTDNGCPCCIQTLDCSEYNVVINKQAALIVIQGVIQAEDIYRETRH